MKGRVIDVLFDAILREASNSNHASNSTVWCIIPGANFFKQPKLKKKPPLNSVQKEMRLRFCGDNIVFSNEWQHVVFSEEQ